MSENLFQRINDESMIHIVEHDDPGEPGYVWRWRCKESDKVYLTQDSALIGGINHLSESYEKLSITQRQDKKDRVDQPFLYPLINTNIYVLVIYSFLVALIAQLGSSLLEYFLLLYK